MTLPCECGTIIIVSLPSSSLKTFAKKDFKILKKETNSLWTVEANFFSIRLYRCVLDNLSSALFPTTIFASITQRLIACQMNTFLRKGECPGGAGGRGRYLETERCCRLLKFACEKFKENTIRGALPFYRLFLPPYKTPFSACFILRQNERAEHAEGGVVFHTQCFLSSEKGGK